MREISKEADKHPRKAEQQYTSRVVKAKQEKVKQAPAGVAQDGAGGDKGSNKERRESVQAGRRKSVMSSGVGSERSSGPGSEVRPPSGNR